MGADDIGGGEHPATIDFELGRPETLTRMDLWSNEIYRFAKDITGIDLLELCRQVPEGW